MKEENVEKQNDGKCEIFNRRRQVVEVVQIIGKKFVMDYEVILKVKDNVGEYGDDEYTEYENLKIKQNEINNLKSKKSLSV